MITYLDKPLNTDDLLDKPGYIILFGIEFNNWHSEVYRLKECLSLEEKIHSSQFYSNDLKYNYIISHGILRYILGYYTGKKPNEIAYSYGEFGKPSLIYKKSIEFNISHSNKRCCYLIACNQEVGVDIEFHNSALDVHEFCSLVFTEAEHNLFNKLNEAKRRKFFFDLWAQKEAVVKANGKGLFYALDSIELMNSSYEQINLNNESDINKKIWYCRLLQLYPDYSLAIATKYKTKEISYIELKDLDVFLS